MVRNLLRFYFFFFFFGICIARFWCLILAFTIALCRLPSQRSRDITYVSRMECVQAAVHAQLEALAQAEPTRPAGMITFAGEVVVHGTGEEHVTLAGTLMRIARS